MNKTIRNHSQIEKIARYGEWISLFGILLVGGYSFFLAVRPEEAIAVLQRGIPGPLTLPSDELLVLAGAVAMLPALLFIYTLWRAHSLFGLIGSGLFLSETSQWLMVHLGKLAIIFAVLGIITHTLVVLIMTSANPPGQKMLLIEIDSSTFSSIIVAVLLFTFSLVMKETTRIFEENKSFI